ncbi:thioredoxin family protein [Vagococcus lutrae]|uniref:thioredoxin family protein n=1 Tax=Vagococcus lutrae TaxID=81947 RepID=UPI002891ED15|nr:thioredoxin family protein [Vagococcus lutrae]MDT2817064.1 thioredoxin family protein [Vagococcus lutrae]
MLIPQTLEEFASLVETGTHVFYFTADWCGDCVYLKPHLADIVATFPKIDFVEINRDKFIEACESMQIFGIPSLVIVRDCQEVARFVDKNRKTKEEVLSFLHTYL